MSPAQDPGVDSSLLDAPAALELHGIWRNYGNVVANRDVDLVVRDRSVHAVLGENGAGKSTLMRILFGVEVPDKGTIHVRGKEQIFTSPRDAIGCGIGMVFQHFGLVRDLSALDNVALGAETSRGFRIDRDDELERVVAVSEDLGLSVPWKERLSRLSVGQQQRVEILKALYRRARILILDEPTALLTPQERAGLFEAVKGLQQEGLSVVFITHKLDEAEYLADDVTVMRGGRVISHHRIADVTRQQLVHEMVGERSAAANYSKRQRGERVLHVDAVSTAVNGQRGLHDVSLDVYGNEIVGIVGIDGQGHQEFCQVLAGARRSVGGKLILHNEPVVAGSRSRAQAAGIGYVPEDRLTAGVALEHSISENLVANRLRDPAFVRFGVLRRATVRRYAEGLIERFDIRCRDARQLVGHLSGGNIQKVVLARELSTDPSVVVVCEPTRGLDIGAIANVHSQLIEAAEADAAVVVQSSDLDEILTLCDRIVVFREQEIVADLDNDASVRPAQIGALMLGQESA